MSQEELIPGTKLIPIGKHKGQPLALLLGDPETQQWWRDHPSVAAKHPYVIQFINMLGEPSPTPVHNRFQIEFLDEALRRRTFSLYAQERILRRTDLSRLVSGGETDGSLLLRQIVETGPPAFEQKGFDVQFPGYFDLQFRSTIARPGFYLFASEEDVDIFRRHPYLLRFDESGTLRVEMKPLLGDDYPAVLRSMCSKKANCLIYDSFDGCVSREELKQFFASVGITVLQRADIENVRLPALRVATSSIWPTA